MAIPTIPRLCCPFSQVNCCLPWHCPRRQMLLAPFGPHVAAWFGGTRPHAACAGAAASKHNAPSGVPPWQFEHGVGNFWVWLCEARCRQRYSEVHGGPCIAGGVPGTAQAVFFCHVTGEGRFSLTSRRRHCPAGCRFDEALGFRFGGGFGNSCGWRLKARLENKTVPPKRGAGARMGLAGRSCACGTAGGMGCY